MTRSIFRYVTWKCGREPQSPHPMHVWQCTTCDDQSTAFEDVEGAQDWAFDHTGSNPSHTGYRETITRYWRMNSDEVVQPCGTCKGHGERVLPNSSAPTLCPDCEGTGHAQ